MIGLLVGGGILVGGTVAGVIIYRRRKTKSLSVPNMSEFLDPEVEQYGVNPLYVPQKRFVTNPLLNLDDEGFDR